MRCKYCKNKEFKSKGFPNHNQRYECLSCGAVKVDSSSSKYWGWLPKWMTKKEWGETLFK